MVTSAKDADARRRTTQELSLPAAHLAARPSCARFFNRLSAVALAICLGLVGVHAHAQSELGFRVTGNLVGVVIDPQGAPAMGASVQLFNKFERLLANTTADLNGSFAFQDLPVDLYSVRISAASYLPVSRDRIAIRPGTDSLLQVHLATLLSTVQITYHAPVSGMTNDWKWVLRSSPATRSIVRYLPQVPLKRDKTASADRTSRVFSDTRAMFSISGGDSNVLSEDSAGSDLGTGFALSTNLVGHNRLQVGGSYAQDTFGSAPPALSLTALYTRNPQTAFGPLAPEVAFTVSQFSVLPGQNAGEATTNSPPVRTMSISLYQAMDVAGAVHVEYGTVAESVDYLQHTSRVSPFARVTLSAGKAGQLIGSFSDGDRPEELLRHQPRHDGIDDLSFTGNLMPAAAPLASLPQVSYSNGQLELQRTHSLELGYQLDRSSRTYSVSVFNESVSNGRVNVAGDLALLNASNLLSDGVSNTSVYNIGAYQRTGALLSVDQHLGSASDFSFAYGRMGGLTPGGPLRFDDASAASLLLNARPHNVASVNFSGRLPKTGTRLFANYGWADQGAIVPPHVFTTQNSLVSPGFNFVLKQPLPQFFGMPGHLLLTADIRNLLAQGYVPVSTADGRTVMLVQSPRTLRGGLNFIF